jgi:hypothetical protein
MQVLTVIAAVDSSEGRVITNAPSAGHGSVNDKVILSGVTAPATYQHNNHQPHTVVSNKH